MHAPTAYSRTFFLNGEFPSAKRKYFLHNPENIWYRQIIFGEVSRNPQIEQKNTDFLDFKFVQSMFEYNARRLSMKILCFTWDTALRCFFRNKDESSIGAV